MSLSFVSKAIQTSTEDGGFEETPVESKDDGGSSSTRPADYKPLFEQLRHNKEQEEEEREEFQRNLMRGTLALNEEDAAHLDSLHKQRNEQQRQVRQQTQQELAAFRAARADRMMNEAQQEVEDDGEKADTSVVDTVRKAQPAPQQKKAAAKPVFVPIIKKRRRGEPAPSSSAADSGGKKSNNDSETHDSNKLDSSTDANAADAEPASKGGEQDTASALGGLLTGYGSSSDEDE